MKRNYKKSGCFVNKERWKPAGSIGIMEETMLKPEKTTEAGKLKQLFLDFGGWLMPLVVSAPSLFIWAGLMTMPLVVYLVLMFLSIFTPAIQTNAVPGPYILPALDVLLLGGPHWPDKIVSITGILIMVGSAVYLKRNRSKGLVTGGPYKIVRNPQYFGAILFICNLTSRSYREVLGDVGWLGPTGTLVVWFGTLAAYIGLAFVEDKHLLQLFGEEYRDYRNKTPFLVPFLRSRHILVEILSASAGSVLLLCGLVKLNSILFP